MHKMFCLWLSSDRETFSTCWGLVMRLVFGCHLVVTRYLSILSMFRLHWHQRPGSFWPYQVRFDSLLLLVVLERNLHEINFIWEYNSVFPRSPNWHKSSKDHLQLISFPQAPFSPYVIQILMILYQSKYCYTHYGILIGVMVVKPCQAHVYYTPCFWRMPRPTQHADVWLRLVCP